MALKIRLRRQGRKNSPFYRLVVVDSRTPRDGKYLEAVGWYNPVGKEDQQLSVEADRVQHWISQGVELTEKAEALVARGAPDVAKAMRERLMARDAKRTAKRRERRRARAKAA